MAWTTPAMETSELNLCDRCLDTAASIADFTGECRVCGNGYALRVMPL